LQTKGLIGTQNTEEKMAFVGLTNGAPKFEVQSADRGSFVVRSPS